MDFIGLLRTLERVTRPPTRPTFSDTDNPLTDEMRDEGWEFTAIPEPPLTPDELVGVRGILQERYNPNFAGAAASLAGGVSHSQPVREDKQQDVSDSVLGLACVSPADPHKSSAPSPTIVQSAPPPTVDGGAGGGGVLHSPGARLPHPDYPTSTLLTNGAHAIELWLTGSEPNTFAREAWEQVVVELRDRAATFKNIEQDN